MLTECIIVILIVAIVYILLGGSTTSIVGSSSTMMKSTIDNRMYKVKDLPDKQEAADTLARLRDKLIRIVSHMETKYPNDANVQRMVARFEPDNIKEGSHNSGLTTYTQNKQKIVYCLRSRPNNRLHTDINMLMLVSLHELAHIMDDKHNPKHLARISNFSDYFHLILSEAKSLGVFESFDYGMMGKEYCGMKLFKSPI